MTALILIQSFVRRPGLYSDPFRLATRPSSPRFFTSSKMRGDVFLDRLEERLVEHGAHVKRYAKPTFTKPAPVDLREPTLLD